MDMIRPTIRDTILLWMLLMFNGTNGSTDYSLNRLQSGEIMALDCRYGHQVKHNDIRSVCEPPLGNTKPNISYTSILQQVDHQEKEAYVCEKRTSKLQEVCGVFSYSKLASFSIGDVEPVNPVDCIEAVHQGTVPLDHKRAHRIKIHKNGVVSYSYVQAGLQKLEEDNVRCQGAVATVRGKNMSEVVTLVSVEFSLKTIKIEEGPHHRFDLKHGLELPEQCLNTSFCRHKGKTYVFQDTGSYETCMYEHLRTTDLEVIRQNNHTLYVSRKHHIVLKGLDEIQVGGKGIIEETEIYADQRLKMRKAQEGCIPLVGLIRTQYKKIWLFPAADRKHMGFYNKTAHTIIGLHDISPTNFDLLLMQAMMVSYQKLEITDMLEDALNGQESKLCKAMIRDGNTVFRSPFRNDSLIMVEGDLVTEKKCQAVKVYIPRDQNDRPRCYRDFLEVKLEVYPRYQKIVYLHLPSRLLYQEKPGDLQEINCETSRQRYLITENDHVVQLYPRPILANVSLDHNYSMWTVQTILDAEYDDVATAYTLTEITDFHKALWHQTREASLSAMVAQEICSASGNCELGDLDLHIPGSNNIFKPLIEPVMSTGRKIWQTCIYVAQISAIVFVLYLLVILAKSLYRIYYRCKTELSVDDIELGEELQTISSHPNPTAGSGNPSILRHSRYAAIRP